MAKNKVRKPKPKKSKVKKIKKKDGQEKILVKMTAEVPLGPEEELKIGREFMEMEDSINILEKQKKEFNSSNNIKTKELKLRINEIVDAMKSGKISKVVDAEKIVNKDAKEVEYWYMNEIIRVVPLSIEDTQKELPLDDKDSALEIEKGLELKPGAKVIFTNAVGIEIDGKIKEVLTKNKKTQIFLEGYHTFLSKGKLRAKK